jgi:hypothetical protein
MSKIFGGSKSKSQSTQSSRQESSNQAYPAMQQQFTPVMENANTGSDWLRKLLGGDGEGFNNYLDATGYDFARDRGEGAITSMFGSKGLRNSGSAMKSLSEFNQGLKGQRSNDYVNQLMGLTNTGFQAGGAISGAGNKSLGTSTGQSTGSSVSHEGIAKTLMAGASMVAASDSRLKKDIKRLGTLENGLGVYEFMYINDKGPFVGVMADEVKTIQPDALGPIVDGYMTVDYSKIEGIENVA